MYVEGAFDSCERFVYPLRLMRNKIIEIDFRCPSGKLRIYRLLIARVDSKLLV